MREKGALFSFMSVFLRLLTSLWMAATEGTWVEKNNHGSIDAEYTWLLILPFS